MIACDFPGSRRIGKPRDWVNELDGECGSIYVTDAVDMLSGQNFMYSVYKPTPDDIAALLNGGAIRLGIMGHSHPVFNLAVLSPEVVERAEIVEKWDMGGVLK